MTPTMRSHARSEREMYLTVPDILECVAGLISVATKALDSFGAADAFRQRRELSGFKVYDAGYEAFVTASGERPWAQRTSTRPGPKVRRCRSTRQLATHSGVVANGSARRPVRDRSLPDGAGAGSRQAIVRLAMKSLVRVGIVDRRA